MKARINNEKSKQIKETNIWEQIKQKRKQVQERKIILKNYKKNYTIKTKENKTIKNIKQWKKRESKNNESMKKRNNKLKNKWNKFKQAKIEKKN